MEAFWLEVKATIKERIPAPTFRMWIEPLEIDSYENENISLLCPNNFSKRRVNDKFLNLIEDEVSKITGKGFNIDLKVAANTKKASVINKKVYSVTAKRGQSKQLSIPVISSALSGGRLLRKNFNFDNFVVGNSNQFAYSAALSMASRDTTCQNSLFLLSNTGLGKSHLSQSIGHHIKAKNPSDRVFYITAEDFTNEMVRSYKENKIENFKDKYRTKCDVLLLEDVHFLTGKDGTQQELAMTLDYLFEANKKIIFSSCYLPSDIPKMNDQLVSRLSSSVISNIESPDYRMRVKILKKKSLDSSSKIDSEVIEYLACELTDNIRQLESGIVGVTAKSSLMGSPIDLDLARSVVENIARQKKSITLESIKKLISKEYRVTAAELVSKSRKQNIVRPRQMAIYLSRKHTDQPLQVIGKTYNRYHATALYAYNSVDKGIKENSAVRRQVDFLEKKLLNG